MKKILLALIWTIGWIHVFWFSPDDDTSIIDYIIAIMEMNTTIIDPMVFMVFNLLGVWPLVMVAMLVQDNQGKLKAWPFAFSSMVLGNSALYIYLFCRRDQQGFVAPLTPLVRFAESKLLAWFLLACTLALYAYGLFQGSFSVYIETWKTNYLVNVMTIDFFLFAAAFASMLGDDMRRRGMEINSLFWFYVLIPVLGPVIYLSLRPPLPRRS